VIRYGWQPHPTFMEARRDEFLTSEARRAESADQLFFLAAVFAEEAFEFLGEFVARGQVAGALVQL
jgi:hypothetical protein